MKKSLAAIVLTLCMMTSTFAAEAAVPAAETATQKETEDAAQTSGPAEGLSVEGLPVIHELEFGGVYIKMSIEDFNARGFQFGDGVRVVFSNGYTLEDLPYYNGYYVDAGQPLLVGYPGYEYVKVAVNYGEDLWETAGLEEQVTASVYLNERGKYINVQEARDIHYSDDRNAYDSDEIFANFRSMEMGDIRPGVLYRAASPCDNQHMRAPYVDKLISDAKVRCILDLADNEAKIENYMAADDFDSPYFIQLYENGGVIPLGLTASYNSEEFRSKVAQGFTEMTEHEGPYLIHCTEGKDRTGFVCMLLEVLAGASYQEIVDDYMLTYDNYYKLTKESDPGKYDTILEKNLVVMMHAVAGDDTIDLETADLAACAREYLLGCGMTGEKIDELLMHITG